MDWLEDGTFALIDDKLHRVKSRYKKSIGPVPHGATVDGYYVTSYAGKTLKQHRIIFALHYGFLPEAIDHINGNRTDNRPANLRQATTAQNCGNRIGVKNYRQTKEGNWQVSFSIGNKKKYFGTYSTEAEAAAVATTTAQEIRGEYAPMVRGSQTTPSGPQAEAKP